ITKYFKKIYRPTNNNLRTSSNSTNRNVDAAPQFKNDNQFGQFGNQKKVNVAVARENVGSQELEAHYSYMAKIQEVPTADSGTDSELVEQVQNDDGYNVFANELQHSEQSESVCNTCLVETNDSNVIPDSPDMCEDDIQNDQNDVESDDERVALANLIANLKLDVDENKKIQKRLKKANTTLAQELKECKTILAKTNLKLKEEHDIEKMLSMEKQLKFLNEVVYKRSQLIQTIHMMAPKVPTYSGRPTFANPRYLKQAQSEIPCLYAFSYDQNTYANRLIPDGEETLALERESRSKLNKDSNDSFRFVHELKQEMHADLKYVESLKKEIDELESDKVEFSDMYDVIFKKVHNELLKRFAKVEKHSISLEIALQKCKEQGKGKSVDTKFDRPSVVRQPNAQRIPKPSILGKPAPFLNSIERMYYPKTKSVPKANVLKGLSKPVTAQTLPQTAKKAIVQLILFIVDSGCTKHMTGNLKLLCNFVEKFLGSVRFGNDQFAPILGYGDLVQGNVMNNRVYYVEGLNHNLFSVGQFCDADLEIANINGNKYILVIVDDYSRYTWTLFLRSKDETPKVLKEFLMMIQRNLQARVITVHTNRGTEFLNKTLNAFFKEEGIEYQTSTARTPEQNSAEAIATACYTKNRSIIISTHGKTSYHIINDKKPSIKHLHIFGCICYITKDGENLHKMNEKEDPCILVGYSTQSKGYRVYNKRTRLIVKSIHIRFDEIKEVSETSVANNTSGLVPQRQKASDYDKSDPVPQRQDVSYSADGNVPSQQELDLLFGPLYDEFFITCSNPQDKQASTSIQPTSEPSTPTYVHAEENNNDQAEEGEHVPDEKFTNPFCTSIQEVAESSSHNIGNSNVPTFNQPQVSKYRWTKGHPLEQVHKNPSRPVQTRRHLATDLKMCMFVLTVSTAEPKNIKEAMADSAWIEAMQEELHQFNRLQGSSFGLTAFSDADHAECIDSRKSTSGGIQFLGDKLVSWMSKKQNCTAMSSAEAEYMTLSASFSHSNFMQPRIALSYQAHPYSLADMFTKALPEDRFKYIVRRIGMRCLTPTELEVLAKESV
nr:hypothetical protein [Tanacetum cinerariifolium]